MTDDVAHREARPAQVSDRAILLIVAAYAAAFVVFGLLVDGPVAVTRGLVAITTSRDTLLTDYFGIGGIGAGCVNAGLLTLCACLVYYKAGARMTGAAVACLFLVLGFALFGKNLLNVWCIVIGVARWRPFASVTGVYEGDGDLDQGGDFSVWRALVRAGVTGDLGRGTSAGVTLNYSGWKIPPATGCARKISTPRRSSRRRSPRAFEGAFSWP